MTSRIVEIKPLTRVEGEGAVTIKIINNKLEDVKITVLEVPRFYEAFIRGRYFNEVPEITSRICGICYVAHQLTAIKAIEKILEVQVDDEIKKLRELLAYGGWIQSHALHLFFLALPDYYKCGNSLNFIKDAKLREVLQLGLKLRKIGNLIVERLSGRSTHPITPTIGGFSTLPKPSDLSEIKKLLIEGKELAFKALELFLKLTYPEYENRDREFIALKNDKKYTIIEGKIKLFVNGIEDFENKLLNYVYEITSHETNVKIIKTREKDKPIVVGPLARINVNYDKLSDDVKNIIEKENLKFPNYNTYIQNVARAIELAQAFIESLKIIEEIDLSKAKMKTSFDIKAGRNAAITEAPRGILYHEYEIDKAGYVKYAQIITPTVYNVTAAEHDLRILIPKLLEKKIDINNVIRLSNMLVRSYDFCLSCSVHAQKL